MDTIKRRNPLKGARRAFVAGALLLLAEAAMAQAPRRMSLEACIDYALENHVELRNKAIDVRRARAQVGETRSMGLPQLNFSTQLNANPDIRPVVLPNVDGTPFHDPDAGETVALPFGVTYDGNAVLSGSQLLFDGSYIVGLMAAKTYRELVGKELAQTRLGRVEAVKKAYYLVLVNRRSLASLTSSEARLEALLKETEAMLGQGLVDETDADRLRVSYNNVRAQRESAERGEALSLQLLKHHMALPLADELALEDRLDESAVLDNADLLTRGFSFPDRIEYQLLDVSESLQRLNVRQYQVQYLPKLELVGNMGYSTGYNQLGAVFSDRWYWSSAVGLKLSLPVFDGLKKHYQIRQARLEREKVANQRRLLKQGISVEIEQAQAALADNKAALEVSRQNMALAQKVFGRTKAMYQAGLGSNLEVVQADDDYRQAEANYYRALYRSILARIELEKATGKLY